MSLTLFGGWGSLETVAFPVSRPTDVGGLLTETWGGLPLRSDESWGDHPGGGARLSRVLGPLDVALTYVHGSDRSFWAVPHPDGGAALDPPSLRQGGYELQWALGPVVLHSEGAVRRRDGTTEARGTVGGEWFPTPYLSFVVEQGWSGVDHEFRSPLWDDLLVGSQLVAEQLRLRPQLLVDMESGNRSYAVQVGWTVGAATSVEAAITGWSGDPTREPALAQRQRTALAISLARFF